MDITWKSLRWLAGLIALQALTLSIAAVVLMAIFWS
jgi:hypothetical protein